MLNPFSPSYDYVKGIPVLTLDEEEILNLKLEAVRRLTEETKWTEQRVSALVQTLSVVNVELPSLVYHRIGLDYDSCNILGRLVLEEVYFIYLGHRLSRLAPLKLPANRLLCVLSTPLLNMLCATLSNPLSDISELLNDNSADESTLMEILLAAYRDYALEYLPRVRLFPKYANKAVEEQILEILNLDT